MLKGSVDSIESMGLVDGPGIRTVVFLTGCKLRCKYCHNPEMWKRRENNYTPEELVAKIQRCKPYFRKNGGVTFSGGEPLLQSDFIIEVAKLLKKENIHMALDTSGVGNGHYKEILKYMDLVLLDIKHTSKEGYSSITGMELSEVEKFIDILNKLDKKVWIRQVVVPGITDSFEYMDSLVSYLQRIRHVERVDFLPFHRLGREKYEKLNIMYPYEEKRDMDKQKTDELYQYFRERYFK